MACEHDKDAAMCFELVDGATLLWCSGCGGIHYDGDWTVPMRPINANKVYEDMAAGALLGSAVAAFFGTLTGHRVPGPLAAGPGGSGETRGASDASTGVEGDSQSRTSDDEQGCTLPCGHWGSCRVESG